MDCGHNHCPGYKNINIFSVLSLAIISFSKYNCSTSSNFRYNSVYRTKLTSSQSYRIFFFIRLWQILALTVFFFNAWQWNTRYKYNIFWSFYGKDHYKRHAKSIKNNFKTLIEDHMNKTRNVSLYLNCHFSCYNHLRMHKWSKKLLHLYFWIHIHRVKRHLGFLTLSGYLFCFFRRGFTKGDNKYLVYDLDL